MQARRNKSSLIIPPDPSRLGILEVYGDLENAENDTRFKTKFRMLFTNRDVIRAYIRREKAKAGFEMNDEPGNAQEDAQDDMEEAHKDVVRHCI